MSIWKPISEERIRVFIDEDSLSFSKEEEKFFESISIPLKKWSLDPWGNHGGGFWAVGVYEGIVLWYNDIEEGFNYSNFSTIGKIDEYWCDQDDLALALRRLLIFIRTGKARHRCSPPSPIH